MIGVAIVTVSDRCARGERDDVSGALIAAWAVGGGYTVAARRVIPDEGDQLVGELVRLADGGTVRLILTTGGTGLGPRDTTPEATRLVLDREAPGISELLRVSALPTVPTAALGRGVAGTRGGGTDYQFAGIARGGAPESRRSRFDSPPCAGAGRRRNGALRWRMS